MTRYAMATLKALKMVSRKKVLLTIVIAGFIIFLQTRFRNYMKPFQQEHMKEDIQHLLNNWRGLSKSQIESMSLLGRRMFLGDEIVLPRTDKNFTILIWKYGPQIEKRLIYHYGSKRLDPYSDCSVSNCRITYNDTDLPVADAVMFHLHRTPGRSTLPERHAHPSQIWVFLTDENPYRTFTFARTNVTLNEFDGLFNWSMTFRMDSDVPVPYGRTMPLKENDKILERQNKTKFAAIMISDCSGENGRMKYLKELRKHMKLDVYGKCGELKCKGRFLADDCPKLNDYKFYLALENGNCKEYITEKVWWNAYHKDSVPVIMGAPLEDCARLLPPKSYIHAANFSSPASLARYLLYLDKTPSEYESFFSWRTKYKVVNEHGYFQAPIYHYCRLCEALNYNDLTPKVYDRLYDFWSVARDCTGPLPLRE